ncbi:MAG: hypothetical protein JWQ64_2788, partial [Subtercola sp.]|nr:hypothetical protein [Subtercola sp.]
VTDLLRAATAYEVLNLTSREADLEEIFLAFYRPEAVGTSEAAETATRESESVGHVR